MSDIKYWAFVDADNKCVEVQVATVAWAQEWTANNVTSMRLVETDPESLGYAGPGMSLDDETGWFIPEMPEVTGRWEFDRDPEKWVWVDLDAPEPELPPTT